MRKKEEKAKLGRPKLADSKTKKKATIYIAIAFALLIAFTMGGIYSLYGSFSTNKLKGYVFCGPYSQSTCSSQKVNGYSCRWVNGGCYGGLPSETKITTTKKTTKKTTVKNKNFTVKFNANGGTGSMNDQSIMHGNYNGNKLTPLRKNSFSKSGYKFAGWRAKRSADNKWYGYNSYNTLGWYSKSDIKKYYIYKNGQGVSRTVAPGAYVTMYAYWEAVSGTQKLSASNTCSSKKNQKDCTSSTQGEWKYSCVWYRNVCYAETLSPQAYKVVYNKNSRNATGTMSDQYITYGVNTKLRKNTFTLSGYKFAGWRAVNNKNGYVYGKNKDGKNGWYNSTDLKTVNFYKDQTTVSQTAAKGETVTMYAQWEADSSQNNATNSTTFKIEKSSTKKNCFNVYAPSNAKYWRVHVYYKSSGASSYGTNKIYSKNHYNDGGKLQEVCFNKGYGDYRILVKKTTGSNDTASGSPSSWKPSGGSVNNSIGWAYKDYNGYNPK